VDDLTPEQAAAQPATLCASACNRRYPAPATVCLLCEQAVAQAEAEDLKLSRSSSCQSGFVGVSFSKRQLGAQEAEARERPYRTTIGSTVLGHFKHPEAKAAR
jgi:hypothetical protein